MIHPNMATMLAFVTTDAPVSPAALQGRPEGGRRRQLQRDLGRRRHLDERHRPPPGLGQARRARDRGRLPGPRPSRGPSPTVCRELAWMIVRDGEGATRVMEVEIERGRHGAGGEARRPRRRHVAPREDGPPRRRPELGADPRRHRQERRPRLHAPGLAEGREGRPRRGRSSRRRTARRPPRRSSPASGSPSRVDLGVGTARARVLASDLGHDYVSLNADYRS